MIWVGHTGDEHIHKLILVRVKYYLSMTFILVLCSGIPT